VELNELEILKGKTGTSDHTGTVTGAGVGGSAGEVGTSVTTGGKNGLVSAEAVHRTVLLVVGHDTDALTVLHDEVGGEVLNEVLGVVAERLAVKGVEHGVSGTVGSGGATVSLSSLAVLERLSSESALVDLALLGTREGETVVLKFEDGVG
jgi:hypothetical protein